MSKSTTERGHGHPRFLQTADASLSGEESARIVRELPSLHGEPAYELEYIKAMLDVAQDDIRHVFLLAGVALGVGALFVSQLPIDVVLRLPLYVRAALVVGLVMLGLAAVSFFEYARAMHLNRMRMVRCLPTLDVVRVRELWSGPASGWARNRHLFHRGEWLLGLGVGIDGFALAFLLMRG